MRARTNPAFVGMTARLVGGRDAMEVEEQQKTRTWQWHNGSPNGNAARRLADRCGGVASSESTTSGRKATTLPVGCTLPTSLAAIYKGWFGLQDVNMNGRESEAMLDAG